MVNTFCFASETRKNETMTVGKVLLWLFSFSLVANGQIDVAQQMALNAIFDGVGCFETTICPRFVIGGTDSRLTCPPGSLTCDSGGVTVLNLYNLLAPNVSHVATISTMIGRLTSLQRLVRSRAVSSLLS
jgi:hypothetical protein